MTEARPLREIVAEAIVWPNATAGEGADRAIAAMFDHLENVTPEMERAAQEVPHGPAASQMWGPFYLAMLKAARTAAEKDKP
jgi:hypothetical protein